MYVQRYPFAPKAVWWKKYTNSAFIGKRVIYKATEEIGFEIDGIPQTFQKRVLANGKIRANEQVEYIDMKINDNGIITYLPIRLLGKIYQYSNKTEQMEEHEIAVYESDIDDEKLKVQSAEIGNIIRFEKNNYIRKVKFDCIKETDQQDMLHQPINGLLSGTSYLTLKTHCFSSFADKPQIGDILFYQGAFWMIEETYTTYVYTPRERLILHIAIKQINK